MSSETIISGHSGLVASLLIVVHVIQGIRAEVECHTNGGDSTLSPSSGIGGLRTCRSSQGCYEAWGLVQEDYNLLYSSGCSTCPQFMVKMKCATCNQTGCNKAQAQRIIASNLICYSGGSETSFGEKTVYCADTVDSCYVLPYLDQRTKKTNWEAGCGISNLGPTVPTPCGSDCTVCKAALCNVPDELRGLPKFMGSGSQQSTSLNSIDVGDKNLSSISSSKPLPTGDSRRSNNGVSNATSTTRSSRDGAGNHNVRVVDKPKPVAHIEVVGDEDFGAFPLSTEAAFASRPEPTGSVSVTLAVAALPVVLPRAALF